MKISKIVTKEVTGPETTDILCNLCGETLSPDKDHEIAKTEYYGLVEAVVTGGYFSTHLEDGGVYTFSLCESCLSDLFNKFKYPCKTSNYLFSEDNDTAMLKDYSEQELKKFLEEMKSQPFKSVEDLKMMDEIEEELEIKKQMS